MGIRGIENLSGTPKEEQTILVEIAGEVSADWLAELLTRFGVDVISVEPERGSKWTKSV